MQRRVHKVSERKRAGGGGGRKGVRGGGVRGGGGEMEECESLMQCGRGRRRTGVRWRLWIADVARWGFGRGRARLSPAPAGWHRGEGEVTAPQRTQPIKHTHKKKKSKKNGGGLKHICSRMEGGGGGTTTAAGHGGRANDTLLVSVCARRTRGYARRATSEAGRQAGTQKQGTFK